MLFFYNQSEENKNINFKTDEAVKTNSINEVPTMQVILTISLAPQHGLNAEDTFDCTFSVKLKIKSSTFTNKS